jgi:UDP-glucose 4-epimerase
MKIGITGCTGFIGGSVARYLETQGHDVVSLDSYTRFYGQEPAVHDEHPKDLTWVIHFAANTSIPKSFADPVNTYYNNISAMLKAIRIAHQSDAAFIYMSSYVYGKPKYLPIDEKHPLAPLNPYTETKIICEEICNNLMNAMPIVILRGFNIYGDCHIPGRLIPDLLECVRKGNPIEINDPYPKRDYLYINDFQRLISSIISKNPVATGIFNVGYGCSYSNQEVAEMICALAQEKRNIIIKSQPRQNDVLECFADISLIKKTFSWKPKVSLEMGLRELIEKVKA